MQKNVPTGQTHQKRAKFDNSCKKKKSNAIFDNFYVPILTVNTIFRSWACGRSGFEMIGGTQKQPEGSTTDNYLENRKSEASGGSTRGLFCASTGPEQTIADLASNVKGA